MFAQSWEDPACDLAALTPRPGETLLAITSGGDNVLGFLLTDPARIVAVDNNPLQAWLFELKRAAFRVLDPVDIRVLFGVAAGDVKATYGRVRPALDTGARAFWDHKQPWLGRGLLLSGAFERYFAMLRALLSVSPGRARLEQLFELAPEEQRGFFERHWDTRVWRTLVGVACSKWMLGRKLERSWFDHAEGSDRKSVV